MTSKNFIIELVVYPLDIMVSVGESDNTLFAKLKKFDVAEKDLKSAKYDSNGQARFCLFTGGQSLIRICKTPKTPEDYGDLQHEIFHAVSCILDRIGMKLVILKSDEAYAYLTGYLVTEIYKRLKS